VLGVIVLVVKGGWAQGYANVRALLHRCILRLRGAPLDLMVTSGPTYRLPYALAISSGVWLAYFRGPLLSS